MSYLLLLLQQITTNLWLEIITHSLSYDSGSQKPESVSLTKIKFFRAILLPEYGEALGEHSFPSLFQFLELLFLKFLGSWSLPPFSKPAAYYLLSFYNATNGCI